MQEIEHRRLRRKAKGKLWRDALTREAAKGKRQK
jgi:hypothetical protein